MMSCIGTVDDLRDTVVILGRYHLDQLGIGKSRQWISRRRSFVPQIASVKRETECAAFPPDECALETIAQRNGFIPSIDRSHEFQIHRNVKTRYRYSRKNIGPINPDGNWRPS